GVRTMRAPVPSAAGPHLDRFVGRTSALADLENDLANLPHPRGPVRILRGVAGVGKTRLAEEVSRRAAATGVAVAWGRSPEGLSAPPYWSWIQVVRSLLDHKPGTDLAGLVLSDPSPVQRFELFDATAGVVRAAAQRSPLLVVLDD